MPGWSLLHVPAQPVLQPKGMTHSGSSKKKEQQRRKMIGVFTAPLRSPIGSLLFLWSWKVKVDIGISSVSYVIFHFKKVKLS